MRTLPMVCDMMVQRSPVDRGTVEGMVVDAVLGEEVSVSHRGR